MTVQAKPDQVTSDNRFTGAASVPSQPHGLEVKTTDPAATSNEHYKSASRVASKSFSYDANAI